MSGVVQHTQGRRNEVRVRTWNAIGKWPWVIQDSPKSYLFFLGYLSWRFQHVLMMSDVLVIYSKKLFVVFLLNLVFRRLPTDAALAEADVLQQSGEMVASFQSMCFRGQLHLLELLTSTSFRISRTCAMCTNRFLHSVSEPMGSTKCLHKSIRVPCPVLDLYN